MPISLKTLLDTTNAIMHITKDVLGGRDSAPAKNKNLTERAYDDIVETKIGRIRSMYYMLGLLGPEVVALDRELCPYAKTVATLQLQ